jgi:Fe-S-cluster containining protein
MGECSRCGDCCRFFAVFRGREVLPPELRQFLVARGIGIFPHMYVVPSVCPHLVDSIDGETRCDIWETRPAICREFKGFPLVDGKRFYRSPRCTL